MPVNPLMQSREITAHFLNIKPLQIFRRSRLDFIRPLQKIKIRLRIWLPDPLSRQRIKTIRSVILFSGRFPERM
jgi:hypothetical protein